MAALCASRWSAIGCLDSRTKNLSMKERPRANCASRWSAVGRTVATTKKKGLTRAGLLMEVADNPDKVGQQRRASGTSIVVLIDALAKRWAVPSGTSRAAETGAT